MAVPTKIQHPLLRRSGTSQRKRITESQLLRSEFTLIDGRKLGDMLDFVYEYARLVVFHEYRTDAEEKGYVEFSNWLAFFEKSLPFTLNWFAKSDFDRLETDLLHTIDAIKQRPNDASLRLLLDFCYFDLIMPLDRLQQTAHRFDFKPLMALLDRTARTLLLSPLRRFIGLSNVATKYFCTARYDFMVFSQEAPWNILSIEELFVIDETVERIPGGRKGKIEWLGVQVAKAAQRFLVVQRNIAQEVPDFLSASIDILEKRNDPHLGLFYAFLRLFEHFQGELNTLTQKHVEFFYTEVLRLERRNMIPDQVHLIFEPAKHLESHLVKQGTIFKDAKDSKNVDILFDLDEEIVIDKTKVTALKTLYLNYSQACLDEGSNNGVVPRSFVEGIYIAPIANSADGKGGEFRKEQSKNWATLGARQSKYTAPGDTVPQNYSFGRIGFILASPVLWLNEGQRDIKITIKCDANDDLAAYLQKFFCTAASQEKPRLTISGWFNVEFSGEDGWFTAEDGVQVEISLLNSNTISTSSSTTDPSTILILSTKLKVGEPAITFYDEKVIGERFAVNQPFPMVKIELNPDEAQITCPDNCQAEDCCLAIKDRANKEVSVACYHFLRELKIIDINICVDVCGVKNLVVQNEESLQDMDSPILPFGARPKIGAEFYIGSKEVFYKNWQKFWLYINWKDKPDNLEEYYETYKYGKFEDGGSEIKDESFRFSAAVLEDYVWKERQILEKEPIFKNSCKENLCSRQIGKKDSSYLKEFQRDEFVDLDVDVDLGYESESLKAGELKPLSVNSKRGFFRMTLDGVSFQHHRYAFVLAWKLEELSKGLQPFELTTISENLDSAIEASDLIKTTSDGSGLNQLKERLDNALKNLKKTISSTVADVKLPMEPYTPLIKTLEIDYSASADKCDIEFIHLHPFPNTSKREELTSQPTLLPTFTDEGTLFIGLEGLRPRSNLHLLFQFAEATADSESDRAKIKWHYLADNQWKELRTGFELLSDKTEQMTRSGIVKIAIPADISNEGNTLMPPTDDGQHLFWLKVSALHAATGVAELIGVHAQAALVTYMPLDGSDLNRVAKVLEPEQISKTFEPDFHIKEIQQPYKSFGGSIAEAEGAIPIRMSELLRHKGRSVDAFDIEHLVLDAFPELFKCKCISHAMGLSARQYQRDLEVAPGFFIVAVVPDLTKLEPGDMLEPTAPVSTLTRVKEFLQARVSPFARIRVMNPRYEQIHVRMKVRFVSGRDKNYYLSQLKTDLRNFLAPWHLGDSDKLSFGQHLVYSDVLGFIEELEYIDFVSDLRLFDFRSPLSKVENENLGLKEIIPLTARSILSPGDIEISSDEEDCRETLEPQSSEDKLAAFLERASPIICEDTQFPDRKEIISNFNEDV